MHATKYYTAMRINELWPQATWMRVRGDVQRCIIRWPNYTGAWEEIL